MQQGAFDDAVVMDVYDDDSDRRGNMDTFDDLLPTNNNKAKKNGNKNAFDVKKPVAVRYEGYILQPEKQSSKQSGSWGTCINQRMPYEQTELLAIAERHRQKDPKVTIHDRFRWLSWTQRSVVNKLIEELRDKETLKNADWIIYDIFVERSKGSLFNPPVVRKLHVIFKRIDKNNKAVVPTIIKDGKEKTSGGKKTTTSKNANIIDVNEPVKKTKNKETANSKQKLKRNNSYGDLSDPMAALALGGFDSQPNNHSRHKSHGDLPDPMAALGLGGFDSQPNNHSRHKSHRDLPDPMAALGLGGFDSQPNNHSRHNSHVQQDFGVPPPPPGHDIPHGAIPVNGQMPPPPPFYSARRAADDLQPFQPFPDVPAPVHMDSPQFNDPNWPHPHGHSHHHRRRSHSLNRRPSLKRSRTDTQMRDLQDQLNNLALTVQTQRNRPHSDDRVFDSDDSYDRFDEDTTFSRALSPTRSWDRTPTSSPHFSDHRARRSLDRSKHRRPSYRGSGRYRDAVDIIPSYSGAGSGSYRRSEDFTTRPSRRMSRAITYQDDYPVRAPEPPGLGQRRFSEYDRDREWERREYRERRGSRYDDGGGRRGVIVE